MLPSSLIALLKRVSRSFYLSVRVLPDAVAAQIGLAYLLARAADTIADTDLLPPSVRLELLTELDRACAGDVAAAARLTFSLERALADSTRRGLPRRPLSALACAGFPSSTRSNGEVSAAWPSTPTPPRSRR